MKKCVLVLDRESQRILDALARDHAGDRNRAVCEALKMHQTVEDLLDQIERWHADNLRRQKQRSARDFPQGKFTTWEAVKRR